MSRLVVSIGEILWDLLPDGPQLGGAPFNFAYRVNTLGDRSIIVSRLGRDDLGKKAYDKAGSLGMNTDYLQWDENSPTGTVKVTLDDANNPEFSIVFNVAYDNIAVTEELLQLIPTADCICFGTLIQRTETGRGTVQTLLDASTTPIKLLDINLRRDCYNEEIITESLEEAHILKLNESEAQYLAELFDFASASSLPSIVNALIQKFSLNHCLVTLGEYGAFAASSNAEKAYVPGFRTDVIDTCGSGDAFTAAFVYRLLRGAPLKECCELGNALGAMVAAQPGATIPISPAEVENFVRGDRERIVDKNLESFA